MNAISSRLGALQADMGIPMSALARSMTEAQPDAIILSLRDEFRAAVATMAEANSIDDISDESLEAAARNLDAACWAIADSPPAQTPAGRALKAAAAKHQLRGEFGLEVQDSWPDRSHELVWHVLTELAADEYTPSIPVKWEPPQRTGSTVGAAT